MLDKITRNLTDISFWVSVLVILIVFMMAKRRGLLSAVGIPASS